MMTRNQIFNKWIDAQCAEANNRLVGNITDGYYYVDPVEIALKTTIEHNKKTPNTHSSKTKKLYINKVIFNEPATIVYWSDNTKTIVKCQEDDIFSKEVGLALCISKKVLGNKSNFNNVFKKLIK